MDVAPADRPAAERPWWAPVVALVAFGAAVWLVAASPATGDAASGPGMQPMLSVAPGGEVDLASLPVEHQILYEAAAADREAFTQVRGYCGCEALLDHRNLLDCFERPVGGWERHTTGCAVCLADAEEVAEQRAEARIWGSSAYRDDHVVAVHIANLRRKLGDTSDEPRYVRTVRGVGYRMVDT